LDWNPQGYRRRCRPKRKWRRTIEDEIRNIGRSWNEVKGAGWRFQPLAALHGFPVTHKESKQLMMMIILSWRLIFQTKIKTVIQYIWF
jgi:hypothetical protein